MRILALADIHGSARGQLVVRNLVNELKPDAIAIAGDLTGESGLSSTRALLEWLPVPTFVVPGNMDTAAAAAIFTVGKSRNLHLRKETVGAIDFVGIGGWIISPSINRSWGIDPQVAEKEVSKLLTEGAVLLTHVPAYGHLDKVPVPPAFSAGSGEIEHIGSQHVRRLVDSFKPAVVISGHVHEDRGIETEGGTLFVNPGPAKNGFGALIELEPHPRAKLLESGNQLDG